MVEFPHAKVVAVFDAECFHTVSFVVHIVMFLTCLHNLLTLIKIFVTLCIEYIFRNNKLHMLMYVMVLLYELWHNNVTANVMILIL